MELLLMKRPGKYTVRFPMERTVAKEEAASVERSDELLRVEDVAKMMKRSKSSIYKRIEKKLIPAHKDGNCWFILRSELISYIKSL